jgi:hypothetical protein
MTKGGQREQRKLAAPLRLSPGEHLNGELMAASESIADSTKPLSVKFSSRSEVGDRAQSCRDPRKSRRARLVGSTSVLRRLADIAATAVTALLCGIVAPCSNAQSDRTDLLLERYGHRAIRDERDTFGPFATNLARLGRVKEHGNQEG